MTVGGPRLSSDRCDRGKYARLFLSYRRSASIKNKKAAAFLLRPKLFFCLILAFDETFLDHLLVAEPQIGDVG